jgi:hypothetical protein
MFIKTISRHDNSSAFSDSLDLLAISENSMTIWQRIENQRSILYGKCKSIDLDNERILFEFNQEINLLEKEIFFYSEDCKIIFKSLDFHFDKKILDIKFPNEFIVLSADENNDYAKKNNKIKDTTEHLLDETMIHDGQRERIVSEISLSGVTDSQKKLGGHMSGDIKTDKISTLQAVKSLDENDIFEHQRSAPRARPKTQKKVTLHLKGRPETSKEYDLFDLSMGGMSFVISDKDLLQNNDEIELTYFDTKAIDSLMLGIIRNIREEAPERFRVGVQFISED